MMGYMFVVGVLLAMYLLDPQALWLIIPMIAANQMAIAKTLRAPLCDTPISYRHLGPNKTVAAYYMSPLLGAIALAIVCMYTPNFSEQFGVMTIGDAFCAGLFIGLGVALGDQGNSAFKRFIGIPPGENSFSDCFDWTVGGGLA